MHLQKRRESNMKYGRTQEIDSVTIPNVQPQK